MSACVLVAVVVVAAAAVCGGGGGAISTERPASTAYGTINTEGGCLKVRRFNEKALIANIHLLNVHLWDQVINYSCTQTERSCTPELRCSGKKSLRTVYASSGW